MLGGSVLAIEAGPMAGLKLVAGEHVSHAHLRGTYEPATIEAVNRLVVADSICYDLGASIGYLSMLMARKAKHVSTHLSLRRMPPKKSGKNSAANQFSNVTIIPNPVSKDERDVRFVLTDVSYGSSINETETRWPVLHLRTTTLDSFVNDHSAPDFIKIDVEGEEGNVLEGARGILLKKRPTICCELHSMEAAQEVEKILSEFHYKLSGLDGYDFGCQQP